MKVANGVNTFAVYEDSTNFYGMAEVAIPEISTKSEEITGAGIGGAVNNPFIGQTEAMTITLNFKTFSEDLMKLSEPRNHQLDIRAAQQVRDTTTGQIEQQAVKYVIVGMPTKNAPGKVANASSADSSVELSVSYLAAYIDGVKKLEIDIFNYIYYVNGKDYAAEVRSAIGK